MDSQLISPEDASERKKDILTWTLAGMILLSSCAIGLSTRYTLSFNTTESLDYRVFITDKRQKHIEKGEYVKFLLPQINISTSHTGPNESQACQVTPSPSTGGMYMSTASSLGMPKTGALQTLSISRLSPASSLLVITLCKQTMRIHTTLATKVLD